MAYDYDKFWKDQDIRNQPRADIKWIAYISSDHMGDTCQFTSHHSYSSAEKKYGDLGRYYRGSSSSDLELIILSMDETLAMIGKKDITYIDWKKKIIHWG